MEQCCIPEDIRVERPCRLPTKSHSRYKCVLKQWCNLISDSNLIIPKTTGVGLVLQCIPYYEDHTFSATFLPLDNWRGVFIDRPFRYNVRGYKMSKDYRIRAARSGFLVLCTNSSVQEGSGYLVYNPITKFLEQIGRPTKTNRLDRVGLVFDEKHIKVLFVCVNYKASCWIFDVYSLEYNTWRNKELEYHPGCLFFYSSFSFSNNKSLFFKSAMHWPLGLQLLAYHLQDEFFRGVELPALKGMNILRNNAFGSLKGNSTIARLAAVKSRYGSSKWKKRTTSPVNNALSGSPCTMLYFRL